MEYSVFLYILTGKYIKRVVIVLIIIIIIFTCTSLNTQVDRDVKFGKILYFYSRKRKRDDECKMH